MKNCKVQAFRLVAINVGCSPPHASNDVSQLKVNIEATQFVPLARYRRITAYYLSIS